MRNLKRSREAFLFRSLMHPARLAVLDALRDGEQTPWHIAEQLGYQQGYVMRQLEALCGAGIMRERRDGWTLYYSATRPEVFDLIDLADMLVAAPGERAGIDHDVACRCPKCSGRGMSMRDRLVEVDEHDILLQLG